MRRIAFLLLFTAVLNAAAGEADDPASANANKALRSVMDQPVSFEFVETPLDEALQFFTRITKLNYVADVKALKSEKEVTIRVQKMAFREAFKQFLEKLELESKQEHGVVYITRKGGKFQGIRPPEPATEADKNLCKVLDQKVSCCFVDTPFEFAINFLQSNAKINVVVDPAFLAEKHQVSSLILKDAPAETVLMIAASLAGAECTVTGQAIFIHNTGAYPVKPLKGDLVEVFKIFMTEFRDANTDVRAGAAKKSKPLAPAQLHCWKRKKRKRTMQTFPSASMRSSHPFRKD